MYFLNLFDLLSQFRRLLKYQLSGKEAINVLSVFLLHFF